MVRLCPLLKTASPHPFFKVYAHREDDRTEVVMDLVNVVDAAWAADIIFILFLDIEVFELD